MIIYSLFDESGNMLRDWAKAGYQCYAFDLLNESKRVENYGKGNIFYVKADINNIDFTLLFKPCMIFGFPPCTDLAVSGARHFKNKAAKDPKFQDKAVALARKVETWANFFKCPWFLENPVSVLATKWRKPNFIFHPYEYGGYLPKKDKHPRWPQYIKPRDAYPKKTCIWHGNGFIVPKKKPVEVDNNYSSQYSKLGGKSAKTKQIRSETPRGWAKAVYLANKE